MATTYEPIATTTLGSSAASYTFSSIPATYTDLVLIVNGSTASNTGTYIRYNSDSASNYSNTGLNGDGTSASSFRATTVGSIATGEFRNYNSTMIINVLNYVNSTTYKTNISRANTASDYVQAIVGLWRSTATINSIFIGTTSANFNTGTTFTLYGIKAA
jgi:hypothetical protein